MNGVYKITNIISQSVHLLVLQLDDVLIRDVELAQLADLLLLDLLNESLLTLEGLLQLLVLDVALLALRLLVLVLIDDLLLQLHRVLLQQLLALVLQLLLQLAHLPLLPYHSLELRLLSPGLLLQHSFSLFLLLGASLLQFMAAFGSDLCLHLLLLPSSSLVGLSCSFGFQSIKL